MGVIANLVIRVTASIADFEKQIQGLGAPLQKMGSKFQSVGSSLTIGLTAPIVGLGVAAVKTGLEFEGVMNKISGVLRPTVGEMDAVRAKAIEMGAATIFSSTDAAEAMLELGKAGFTTKETMAGIGDVLTLAAASGLSMGDTASLAARALRAFGLDVSQLGHVNDVFAKAVNTSTLEITDLQTSFKYIGPIAQGFGVSIEEVTAALAVMRDGGIAAETSGRALREGLTRIVNPVKAVRDVMADMGIQTFMQSNGELMKLSDIIGILHDKGMTAGQAMKMFGDAAGPAMYMLIRQGKAGLDELTAGFVASDGAAKAMADAMMTGLPGAFERFKGSVETALVSISKALEPTLIPILDMLGNLADFVTNTVVPAFQALPVPVQQGIVIFTGLVAALGPVLYVLGTMATALGGLMTLWPTMVAAATPVIALFSTAIPAAFTAVLPFLGPVGLIAAGIAAVVLAWKYWDEIVAFFSGAWQYVVKSLKDVPTILLPLLGPIGLVVATFRHWDEIVAIAQRVFTGVKTWLVDRFAAIVEGARQKIEAVTGFFRDMYTKVVGQSYVPDMVNQIDMHIGRLDQVMVNPTMRATSAVSSLFGTMGSAVEGAIGNMLSKISSMMSGWLDNFMPKWAAALVGGFASNLMKAGSNSLMGMLGLGGKAGGLAGLLGGGGGGLGGVGGGIAGLFGGGGGAAAAVGGVESSIFGGGGGAAAAGGLGSAATIGLTAGIGGAALLGWAVWKKGLFRGGEEAIKVNPARDKWFSQFGPGGTGPGSGFANVAARLAGIPGGMEMFKSLTMADTMSKFAAATQAIDRVMGTVQSFANEGIVTRPTLAMIGDADEPEYVLRESTLRNWMGNERAMNRPGGEVATSGGPQIIVNITAPYASEKDYIEQAVTKGVLEAIGGNARGAWSKFESMVGETRRGTSTQDWRPRAR